MESLRTQHELEQGPQPKEGTSAGAVSVSSSVLTELVADEQWREIVSLFANHPRALAVFRLKVDGWLESEIKTELGMDNREWERERKRIQRMCAKYVRTLENDNVEKEGAISGSRERVS